MNRRPLGDRIAYHALPVIAVSVVAFVFLFSCLNSRSGDCETDWDGRSNSTVCR